MKLRRAVASSCWPRRNSDYARGKMHELEATFVPFTAQTRMSGVDLHANGAQPTIRIAQRRGRSGAEIR